MTTNFSIGKTYRFNTMAPTILGASVINAKLVGVFDYERAVKLDPENIDVRHRTIYPVLPPGTPDKARQYTYYQFETQSEKTLVLADVWIDMASVEVVTHINFAIYVTNASISDMTAVGNLLGTTGLQFTIEQQ